MGVVHKLKKEIINFILSQKEVDLSLSCRQLAVLVSETFHIKVAKSSVNKIIKEARLSGPVGRHALFSSAKKFQIPFAKKKELLENFESVEGKNKEIEIPVIPEGTASELTEGKRIEKINSSQEEFLIRVNQARSQRSSAKRIVYEGMGSVFLKIAQWELGDPSFLTRLIKKNVPGIEDVLGPRVSPDNFENLCDGMLFLKILGQKAGEETGDGQEHALWVLNGISDPLPAQRLKESIQTAQIPSHVCLEYFNIKEQILHEVKGFKIFLEDGNFFIFDVSLGFLAAGGEDIASCWPINKAIEFLSRHLISNTHSVILNKIPTESEPFKEFCEMVGCFEGLAGKNIKRIQVLDKQGEGLADFSIVPLKKRTFVAGLRPARKEFGEYAGMIKRSSKTPYYCEWADKIFYFSEGETHFLEEREKGLKSLRIVIIWEEKKEEPVLAVVTNNKKILAPELITDYFLRWPNWESGTEGITAYKTNSCEETPGSQPSLFPSLGTWEEIFYDFGNSLHAYCQKKFFPCNDQPLSLETAIDRLYGLAGYFTESKNTLFVTLLTPSNYLYKQEVECAVKMVNESCVEDKKGLRIRMEAREAAREI